MLKLLQTIVERSELSIRKDSKGNWQIAAKGPLPLLAIVFLALLWHWYR